ncbi:MAG: HNH endonuclease [Janthinobacterium lividum]
MDSTLSQYLSVQPSLENRWRAVILFGRNSASYKFALAHAMLDLQARANDLITLEELAVPFTKHVCRHLAMSPRQGTGTTSKFLESCQNQLEGTIEQSALYDVTVQSGFVNVIDAFHTLGGPQSDVRFFVDERRTHKGIRITEAFQQLTTDALATELLQEVEARWRLVETAWNLRLAAPLIEHDVQSGRMVTGHGVRRIDVTSSRDALNGYQKSHCFYCAQPISITSTDINLSHVDHFIPFMLSVKLNVNLNGVWNLVLACRQCNLQKSDLIPASEFVNRLYQRNEFFIVSHHPLKETLMAQTGQSSQSRAKFIGSWYSQAKQQRVATWEPKEQGKPIL